MELRQDYTDELKAIIPESQQIASTEGLEAAVQVLLAFEKKARLANDFTNLKEVCVHLVRLCREKNDWGQLNSALSVINKRRSQSKMAIEAIVLEAYTYLEQCPTVEIKIALATTLKDVCEGKIYVEAQSARLHLIIALILEEQKDIGGACDMIQDVHVETYGSISKKEKAEYILQQMRLNLLRKDYVRTMIQSRKMNRKTIEETGFEDIKIAFYKMMIEYYIKEKDTWEICLCYYKIYEVHSIPSTNHNTDNNDMNVVAAASNPDDDSVATKMAALESCVIYLVISKFDNHASDMMNRLKILDDTDENNFCDTILKLFTTPEIIPYPFNGQELLDNHTCFSNEHMNSETSAEFKQKLYLRVIQHNIRTCSKYYRKMYTNKLSAMLSLSDEELEKHLSDMAGEGDIYLKIDRPNNIVSFSEPTAPETVLSDWSSDMNKLLGLMESTCHLINREEMVNR